MNCTCERPTSDCPEHGTGCDGRRYTAVKAERDELRDALEPFAKRAAAVIRAGACADDDEYHAAILLGLVDA